MKQFCTQCGKQAEREHRVCVYCGTPLKNLSGPEEKHVVTDPNPVPSQPKKPMSKKKKILISMFVTIFVLLIGFSSWAKSYHSSDSVQERFSEAVEVEDIKKIKGLMVHKDGSDVSEAEIKAYLKLVKEVGQDEAFEFAFPELHGKFLWVFDRYKIETIDQFATYDRVAELSFTFNGMEAKEVKSEADDYITFGPLAPGIYQVEAIFSGEFGEAKDKTNMILTDYDSAETRISTDLSVGKVIFSLDDLDAVHPGKTELIIGDEKIAFNKEGETKPIGPLLINGSQDVAVSATYPWGTVKTEGIKVDDENVYISPNVLSDEQYKDLRILLHEFGEQFLQAKADKNTKPLKHVTKHLKDEIKEYELPDYDFYSGKLNKVLFDKTSLYADYEAKQISIELEYEISDSYHSLDEKPALDDTTYSYHIGLIYDDKNKKWLVNTMDASGFWGSLEATDELEGKKKVYGPGAEAKEQAANKVVKEEISSFLNSYTQASVSAINNRDFSLMADYVTNDGPRRKEARDYIDYLESKDIYEDFESLEVEKVEKVEDGVWKVTIIEAFTIYYPDDSKYKEFRSIVNVKKIDGEYFVDELVSVNEI